MAQWYYNIVAIVWWMAQSYFFYKSLSTSTMFHISLNVPMTYDKKNIGIGILDMEIFSIERGASYVECRN